MVEAIHTAVAGRARFKVEGLYRSKFLEKLLESRLARLQDISLASANALTGNVLVCYNSGNNPQTIAALIEEIVSDCLSQSQPGSSFPVPSKAGAAAGQEDQATVLDRFKGLFAYPVEQPAQPWHRLEAEAVLAEWQTSREMWLSLRAVQRNRQKYGANLLPEAEPRSAWEIFLDQFKSLPVALLGVAAGLSVVIGGLADAVLISGVVIVNAFIGYKTESESEKTIRCLQTLVQPTALVLREGRLSEIPSEEVTPGDLLVLRPGSYVAADARLIEASHLSVDESALTGESLPVIKNTRALERDSIPLGDRINLVFKGTLVTGGEGLAVVVATGIYTEIGLIQSLIGEAASPETPLERQLGQLGNQLVLLCCGVCGVVFVMGFMWGFGWLEMLRTSICLAAAAVPEGLPTVATTTLAMGIRDMRKHYVLIRHLNAVETLGSVQTVCLDKTGTITRNQMSVLQIFACMKTIKVAGGQFLGPDGPIPPFACEELEQLLKVSVLCNEIEIYQEGGDYVLRGTPTEGALVHLAILVGLDVADLRRRYPLLKINHRSENRLFMGTLHDDPPAGRLFAIKGSPLEVLALCSWHLQDGRKLPLTDADRQRIEAKNEEMAGDALRVLGLAYALGPDESVFEEPDDLVWLGIMGMADPIREGVGEAIRAFHQAGIETVMITGDQSPTAYAIGKELELSRGGPLEILDATHLAEIEPEVLRALVKRAQVFARVSPSHKLEIVQALQAAGKVVAMTGDGINDGPALKAADVGIAMGRTGTDIAREVADVVLEKDNLDTLILAIRDGRTIYINIRKSVHFFLATNLSEIMLTFVAMAVGLGSPLTAAQLLWINLISDIFPGLALAMEAPEPDILERPPRDPARPIFTSGDFKRMAFESGAITTGALGAYGYGLMRYGLGAQTSTLAFHSLTTGQLLHAISCRSETHGIFSSRKLPPNRYLTLAVGGSLAVQFLTLAVPGLRSLLGLAPVGLLDGLVISGSALLPLVVNEATKKPPADGVNGVPAPAPK
ncbi:MAG: HAD-IC family P-type ATPase [Desulfobaccales bacterium]